MFSKMLKLLVQYLFDGIFCVENLDTLVRLFRTSLIRALRCVFMYLRFPLIYKDIYFFQ